jgi:putative hemolysin
MAIVSARKARLQQLANEGDTKALAALALAQSPDTFLSTVQIGITLVGILTGIFGGAIIAEKLGAAFNLIPLIAPHGDIYATAFVVVIITICTLIFGELVPKRLALAHSESLARIVAAPMNMLSRIAKPMVWFLSNATTLVLRLLRVPVSTEPSVTEEEVKILIEQGTEAGTFHQTEKDMIDRVFRLADRSVSVLMTPRPAIVWLNLDDSPDSIRLTIAQNTYSFFPVSRGTLDDVVGIARSKNVLSQVMTDSTFDLTTLLVPPLFVLETTPALKVLERFKQSGTHLALVVDEYGSVAGLVTFDDILESIFADVPDADNEEYKPIIEREDGSLLIDGMLPIDEFADALRLPRLHGDELHGYQTVGGFVMQRLGTLPIEGRHFEWNGLRIEVVDMDGRRVDKVLVTRL